MLLTSPWSINSEMKCTAKLLPPSQSTRLGPCSSAQAEAASSLLRLACDTSELDRNQRVRNITKAAW